MHTLLCLQSVAPRDTFVIDPVLPMLLPDVVVEDLRTGGTTATLRFSSVQKRSAHGEVLRQRGTLHLLKRPPREARDDGAADRLRAFVDGVWHR